MDWPTRKTYLFSSGVDTGCSLKDLPRAMANRDGERDRERERVSGNSILFAQFDDDDDDIQQLDKIIETPRILVS